MLRNRHPRFILFVSAVVGQSILSTKRSANTETELEGCRACSHFLPVLLLRYSLHLQSYSGENVGVSSTPVISRCWVA